MNMVATERAETEGNGRVSKLKEGILRPPELCVERGYLITESYKETESEPIIIRKAKALEKILKEMTISIEDGELIADCPPEDLSAQTGWNVTLKILLEDEDLNPALETLDEHGFNASPNGKGIRVKVTPGQKGRPISVLTQAGIQVEDFEIEQLNGS